MAVTLNYSASFKGRVNIPTEYVERCATAFDKLITDREAGEPLDGYPKYLSHSEDLETFIHRCVTRAIQDTIKEGLVCDNFRSVGNIRVKFNG